jgi:asparagine synthase (glutamine-hydrolysing)
LFDESRHAQLVADRYGTDHHVFRIRASDMIDALPSVLETFDEPFSDSSAIPTFIVSRETRKHVTVALSGDGGDELFAGYRSYLAEYWRRYYLTIPAIFRKSILERHLERLRDGRDSRFAEYVRRIKKFMRASEGSFDQRAMALKEIMPKDIRKRLLTPLSMSEDDPARRWIQPYLHRYPDDSINALLYSDFADSLPGDMLNKVDWMSMKNSLEVRVPLLDHRVASLAFAIPGSMKLGGGTTKYLLKKAFADLLPKPILRRPKSGFEIPIGRWLRGELRFLVDEYLSPEKIRAQGIFDEQPVRHQTALHLEKKADTSWTLWNLIVFGHWFDHYTR